MCFRPFKRICNLGPLTALAIVKVISLMSIHCSRQVCGPHKSAFSDFSFITFIVFSGLTLYNFMNSVYEGPGYLPYNWTPEKEEDCQFLQFCNVCLGYKAPRSHHCRKCGRCILKMDHHCPWINNCVGHYNHGYFTSFLASAVVGCCISTYIMINWLIIVFSKRPFPFYPPSVITLVAVILSTGLSIGVVIAVGMLLYFQLNAIIKNQTGIETWILEKAYYRRSTSNEKFINPYSKNWYFNIRQVLSWHCVASGDGIIWPVIDGCDQYTLTREQLAQKEEKRRRAKRYRVVAKATGSWCPINHGLKVLCSPPFTDEPRIKLDIGNTVIVTRWRNYWLFGEKEIPKVDGKNDTRIRGWFPRPCTIPVSEKGNELENYLNIDSDTQYFNSTTSASPKQKETEKNYTYLVQNVTTEYINKKKIK